MKRIKIFCIIAAAISTSAYTMKEKILKFECHRSKTAGISFPTIDIKHEDENGVRYCLLAGEKRESYHRKLPQQNFYQIGLAFDTWKKLKKALATFKKLNKNHATLLLTTKGFFELKKC